MRYIDKYANHEEALAINHAFLKDCYKNDIGNPLPSPANPDRSYADFKKTEYRDSDYGWKRILLSEQTVGDCPRCCYCMRRLNLSKGKINYEHVIPRSLNGETGQFQYGYYAFHASALRDHVIMADEFASKQFDDLSDIDKEVRMPHTTALSNLVVACNGTRETFNSVGCCCNGTRKDDMILPIMLMRNADTDVIYDQNGIVSISCNKDGTLNKMIKELNSDTFKEIRSVWYHLSRVSVDLSSAETMSKIERINWFKEAYRTDNFAKLPEEVKRYSSVLDKTNEDTYWKLLLAYDWFYYYPGYAKQRQGA